jgi:predicted nuclease of predicted toxin-antitoxin system
VRLLIDNALSPVVARELVAAGHDAVHVRDRGLQHASDAAIMELAASEGRTLISADADFGMLLAAQGKRNPSVILLRRSPNNPEDQVRLLVANLPSLQEHLSGGCVAVLEQDRIRLRSLPIVR